MGKEHSQNLWREQKAPLVFSPSTLYILNNGHSIQVNYDSGSTLEIDGIRYPLVQFHLAEVLRALPKAGFVGVNVTVPHKVAVLELADLVTDRATLIGAANTLIFREDGKIPADVVDNILGDNAARLYGFA